MAGLYPQALQRLIQELSRLPGVGPKSAQRLAFYLLSRDKAALTRFSEAVLSAKELVHPCPVCGGYTDEALCSICADPRRDRSLLCVVEQPRDVVSMERSRSFNGVYQVLGGVISPMDGVGPEQLAIRRLLQRVEEEHIREVVVATNPNVEGEATALYIADLLKDKGVAVSRIAHGLPVGGDLEFADEATLALALADRKPM
ncbi:MAG: recombination mediator RecR [Firmicutes bacterium]|nr:recombination mediator RecR [Bacillota bacterium]